MTSKRSSKFRDLHAALASEVIDALSANQPDTARRLVQSLHSADIADLLEHVSHRERERLVEVLREGFDPKILTELDDAVAERVIDQLGHIHVAEAVGSMETDDAVDVVEALDPEVQQAVLEPLAPVHRTLIEEGLSYPENSAGRLMQRQVAAVPADWTVGKTIDYLRDADDLPADFFDLFLTDPERRPIGTIPLSRVLRTPRGAALTEIMRSELRMISADMDQEEVAFLFRQRDLISAPVIDAEGRLLGVVTVDDVVDVIHEEHEEDIMGLAGVGTEDDRFHAIRDTIRSRFVWLTIHLVAAIAASAIISRFAGTIEELVALAILMPIVATMGGTAGIQALTVAVRAIAAKELTATNALRSIRKEILVSSLNGLLFGVLIGGLAWAWFGSPALGGVIALAMVINLLAAGLTGSALPVVLQRAGFDPAVASSALLTSVTDVVGFYVFLALAAVLLL
ncbi:MAG: magnesium transporter [Gammaproteobacteria bacterium]|nr:magnesium transporter [Gammaproteobacteria bacterium]